MSHWNKVYELHRILSERTQPVSQATLLQELDCAPATLKRVLQTLRDLSAPVDNVRGLGWRYGEDVRGRFELPGLWLSNEELHALALLDQLLDQIDPGLLRRPLAPVRARIRQMKALLPDAQALGRLKLLPQGRREVRPATLGTIARATVARRRLRIDYHSRSKDEHTAREVSPQHLARYRDNWYLDAWCHQRGALRRFAIDRVHGAEQLGEVAHDVPPETLQAHLGSAYGIFAGPAAATAILHFSPDRARWIADEHWHDDQHGRWLDDGRYELHVPYSDPTELLMDLLRHVPDVEVIAPAQLRSAFVQRLRAGLERHAR